MIELIVTFAWDSPHSHCTQPIDISLHAHTTCYHTSSNLNMNPNNLTRHNITIISIHRYVSTPTDIIINMKTDLPLI